jgi:hypothetical protein
MSPYSDTTSCNFSPERRGGATYFSTLPTKIIFYVLSVFVICWQETPVAVKKGYFTLVCSRELFSIKSSFGAVVQPKFY